MNKIDIFNEKLKDDFIKIYNKPYTQDEYFKVIISTGYDYVDYAVDGFYKTTDVTVEVQKPGPVEVTGFWGNTKTVIKPTSHNERIGVYAVKKADGIHEIVTGMKLYPVPSYEHLCCYGIELIRDDDVVKLAGDLQLLNSNVKFKNQYITTLNIYTTAAWNDYFAREKRKEEERQAPIIKAQREAEAFQFLKNYKLPGTN